MSTEVLSPIFNYFSPLTPALLDVAATSRREAVEARDRANNPIITAALRMVIGALTFVVLLLPSLLLMLLKGELERRGLVSAGVVTFLNAASNVLASIDLVLFLMYAFRSLLRAVLEV